MWMCQYFFMSTKVVPDRFLIKRCFTQLHYNLIQFNHYIAVSNPLERRIK